VSALVTQQTTALAKSLKLDGASTDELIGVLKATAFKGQVSDAQMAALLVVANQYGLNPWTKEIYAFPDKNNGIVPVVGVDGWSRIINSDSNFDGMEFVEDNEWTECIIFRKDRSHPIKVREYMVECKRANAGPWQSHPRRMLRHKAMIQCARLAFGFVGIYDLDEAERIVEGEYTVVQHGRPGTAAVARTIPEDSPERRQLIAAADEAAKNGVAALEAHWKGIGKDSRQLIADQLAGLKERAAVVDAERTEGAPA
jgi:phage recombination protein Bet